MLWGFEMEPKLDSQTKKPILPDTSVEKGYWGGLTMVPHDFPCEFVVRSEARRALIAKGLEEAQRDDFPRYEQNELFMRSKA